MLHNLYLPRRNPRRLTVLYYNCDGSHHNDIPAEAFQSLYSARRVVSKGRQPTRRELVSMGLLAPKRRERKAR